MFGSPPQVMMDDVIERIFSINNPKNSLLLPLLVAKRMYLMLLEYAGCCCYDIVSSI